MYEGGRCVTFADGANSTQLHSVSCALKPRHHFDSIFIAFATTFQVITKDIWTHVMWDTYLVSGPSSFVFFPLIVIFGNFVVLNLFLAILLSTFSAMSKAEAKAETIAAASKVAAEEEAKRLEREAAKAQRDADRAAGRLPAENSPKRRHSMLDGRRSLSLSPTRGGRTGSVGGGADKRRARTPSPGAATSSARSASPSPERAGSVFGSRGSSGGSLDGRRRHLSPSRASDDGSEEYHSDGGSPTRPGEHSAEDEEPPTWLGRLCYRMLPDYVQETAVVRQWVQRSQRRHRKEERAKAALRGRAERQQRKQRRSVMRARTSKFGSLNAWEVAFFKDAFARADLDGDGHLSLNDVYSLLLELDEEPKSHATWDVLDANAARDDLISQSEFLVFISIKRNDDEGHVAGAARPDQQSNVTDAMRKEGVKRRRQIANKARRRSGTVDLLLGHSRRLGDYMRTVYLDRLPPLGEFAVEGLGEERARLLQRLIYSNYFWFFNIAIILFSSLVITSEIDALIRRWRLRVGAASPSGEQLTDCF